MHYTVFNHELAPSDGRTECVRILISKVSKGGTAFHLVTWTWPIAQTPRPFLQTGIAS